MAKTNMYWNNRCLWPRHLVMATATIKAVKPDLILFRNLVQLQPISTLPTQGEFLSLIYQFCYKKEYNIYLIIN